MNGLFKDRLGGWVYMARAGKQVKIGGTGNVKTRMAQLRLKYPNIELIARIRSDRYMLLEKLLHIHLKKYNIQKEWYKNEKRVIRSIYEFLNKHGEIVGAYEIDFVPTV